MSALLTVVASLSSLAAGALEPDLQDPGERRADLVRLAAAAGDSAHSQLQLARTAREWGLHVEMWRHLDRCVGGVQEGSAVQRQLGAFLGSLESELLSENYRDAGARARARGLVRKARPGVGAGKMAAIVELLAREPEADEELRVLARTEPLAEQRRVALEALQRRGGDANTRVVQLRTVMDRDDDVRRAAAALVRASGATATAVQRIAPGLMHDVPGVRIRTAEAMAELGDPAAIPDLVEHGPLAGTPAQGAGGSFVTRAHMYQTTTRSYIRDFDVEIAQAAAVANPVVDGVRDGVVLDVAVAAVITQRVEIELAYREALRRLAGADPGPDPRAWAAWWAARGARPVQAPG